MKNARFWYYICPHGGRSGPVKITLKPSQTLGWYSGGPTDEGWSFVTEFWKHEGDYVENETIVDGRDCDGRLTRCHVCVAKIDELAVRPAVVTTKDDRSLRYPQWKQESASQRDAYAEAMGY